MIHRFGEATTYETHDGPFGGNLVRARNVLCPDGKRRNAFPSHDGIADTFFSIPAYVHARHEGKSVRVYGYVTIVYDDVRFVPYRYRKHANAVRHPMRSEDTICIHCGNEVREVRNAGTLTHHTHVVGSFLCDLEGYRAGTITTHAETVPSDEYQAREANSA